MDAYKGKELWTYTSVAHPWVQFPDVWRSYVHPFRQYYASIKNMGMYNHRTTWAVDGFWVPERNIFLVWNVQINPRTTAKYLVKLLAETGNTVSLSTAETILYYHELKITLGGESHCFKTTIKSQTTVCKWTWGQKKFWRHVLWADETKIELFNHNEKQYIWRKNGEALKPQNTAWELQHHVVGLFYCRRDWCTTQKRWHHEKRKLCGHIEATSEDSQEVEAWTQMGLPYG